MRDRRTALQDVLVALIDEGKDIVCVSVDSVSRFKKVKEKYPERVIECGICEQSGMGICAGLALQGMVPVISGYATFLTMRAFEQIRTDICRWALNVKICGTDTGFSAQYAGFTHQALEDIGILSILDNLVVCEPCDYEDTVLLGRYLFETFHGPVYMRFGARGGEVEFPIKHQEVKLGHFEPLTGEFRGADVTFIALGQLVGVALEVAQELEKKGYKTFVFNARFVKPLDNYMVACVAHSSRLVVTLEEHAKRGGLGDNLLLAFQETGHIPPLLKLGAPSHFGFSGERGFLLRKSGLEVSPLVESIVKEMTALGELRSMSEKHVFDRG